MTSTTFTDIAGGFLRHHVLPQLQAALADDPGDYAQRQPLLGFVAAWIADIAAGRDAEALAPQRFAQALETIWLLGVAGVAPVPGPTDRYVDIVMRRDIARAVELAAAAARTLDMLRHTDVAGAFHARQFALVDRMADAAQFAQAETRGSA